VWEGRFDRWLICRFGKQLIVAFVGKLHALLQGMSMVRCQWLGVNAKVSKP